MPHRHTILLNDGEQKILEKLIKERGYRKQDIFRYRLRAVYDKEFPPYNQSKRQKKLMDQYMEWSNEDFCTKVLGGKVEGDKCKITRINGWVSVPLIGVKFYREW